MPANRAVLKLYQDAVSLLESKAQGFRQLPAIREWLDSVFGERASRQRIMHADLGGDWRDLF